jgi:outer membrane receptor protein involved in Fe transport
MAATPAFAQTPAPVDTLPEEVAEDATSPQDPTNLGDVTNAEGEPIEEGAIVVTGSRVRRNNFNTPAPVQIYNREDTVLAGAASTAETLMSASVTSGTSQISSAFLGFLSDNGSAANVVGLRGLGSQRTLVLLNGRRLAPAGVGSQLVAADLNVLPTAVVQRIEVLKEGASAVYGSDAIAGVINVITDTKMDGITLDLFTDLPTELRGSSGRTYKASITAGKTFDRGFILGSFEYQQRNGVRFADNPDWRCPRAGYKQNGVEVGQVDPATGELACFAFGPNGSAGSGIASGYGLYGIYFGGAYNNIYTLGRVGYADGDMNDPISTNDFFTRPIAADRQLRSHVISPIKTYTAYVNGGYELGALGDAELYGELLFTRRKSEQEGATQFSIDAAQLSPLIQIYGGNYYGTGQPISDFPQKSLPGAPPLPNYQASPFYPDSFLNFRQLAPGLFADINRFNPFILPQQLQHTRQKVDFWRANGGIRGNTGLGDWRYDANVQVSRTRANQTYRQPTIETASNVLMAALAPAGTPGQLTVTAPTGTAGAGGVYTCASNITNGAYNGGLCAPLNIFDPAILTNGIIPDAVYDYLYVPIEEKTRFDQDTFSLIFDGSLFDVPGGTVRGAVGLEYRRDKIVNTPSEFGQAGQLYNRTNEGITKGKDAVREAFAELNIPLITDRPFAHQLEFDVSGRYTDYDSYGSDFVYRLNAQWAPIKALRFRGSYGTNFRAPNLYEQFVNNQQGFYGGGLDPCDSFGDLDPGSNTYINCLAQLTPILGAEDALDFFNANSIVVNTTGGQDNLSAETAKSYGFGAVFTMPPEIGEFTFAADYFHTTVKGEVSVYNNNILNFCYNQDPADFNDPNNFFCSQIAPRNPLGTSYPGTLTSFQNPYVNLAGQIVEGIDFNARYATPLMGGRFVTTLQATRMLKQALDSTGDGYFDYNGTPGYPGFGSGPKWTASLDTRFSTGQWTFRHGLEFIGRSSAESLVTPVLYPANGGTGVAGQPYEEDLVVEEYWEHSVSVQYKIPRLKGQLTVGVKNLFDEKPPSFSDSQDPFGQYFRIANYFGGGPYDYLGRSVFINLTAGF